MTRSEGRTEPHDENAQLPGVRALHRAVAIEGTDAPADRAFVRIFYPAAPTGSDLERLTGDIPPVTDGTPLPVVVFLSGVNIGSDTYRWLAVELARRSMVVATFDHIGSLTPGAQGLSPGLDLAALTPDAFGSRPSATAVGPVLELVESLSGDGLLAGVPDPARVALGGHSAGGTVALLNARPDWFPGVEATFAYGAHTMPAEALGHPAGTVLPVGPVPALLLAGEIDGVISSSADRYGAEVGSAAHSPVSRTFEEATAGCPHAYEVTLGGANHLAVCEPEDDTTARGFLEATPVTEPARSRTAIIDVLAAFLSRHLCDSDADPVAVAQGCEVVSEVRSRTPH